MTEGELKTWAKAHAEVGSSVAKAVLELLEVLTLRGKLLTQFAEKIAQQSDILSANSEKGELKDITLDGSVERGCEREVDHKAALACAVQDRPGASEA